MRCGNNNGTDTKHQNVESMVATVGISAYVQHKKISNHGKISNHNRPEQPTCSGTDRLQSLWTTATSYNRMVCKTRSSFYWTDDKFSRHKNTNTVVPALGINQ